MPEKKSKKSLGTKSKNVKRYKIPNNVNEET